MMIFFKPHTSGIITQNITWKNLVVQVSFIMFWLFYTDNKVKIVVDLTSFASMPYTSHKLASENEIQYTSDSDRMALGNCVTVS